MKKSAFSTEIQNGIIHLTKNDPILERIIRQTEPCIIHTHRNYYVALLRAIIGQQLSTLAAASIYKRVTGHFGRLPKPEMIAAAPDTLLRSFGLSNAKTKYVKDLSNKILNKELILKKFSSKSDEEIIAELTCVMGIGLWTAHMFLMFTLGRLNVLPHLDLGIRKSVMSLYRLKELPEKEKMEKIAKKYGWHPYCTIACWYLWKSLDDGIN